MDELIKNDTFLLPERYILGLSGMSCRNWSSFNWKFSILTLLMSIVVIYPTSYTNQTKHTVIEFSWRDCAGFLFVVFSITHCVLCLGWFLFFLFVPSVLSLFGTINFVILQIYMLLRHLLLPWESIVWVHGAFHKFFSVVVILYVHVSWIDSIARIYLCLPKILELAIIQ